MRLSSPVFLLPFVMTAYAQAAHPEPSTLPSSINQTNKIPSDTILGKLDSQSIPAESKHTEVSVTSFQGYVSANATFGLRDSCGLHITKDYCTGIFAFTVDSCFDPVTDTQFDWYFRKKGAATGTFLGTTFNERAIDFSASIPTSGDYEVVVVVTFIDFATGKWMSFPITPGFVNILAPPTSPYPGTKPLLRYFNDASISHFYTTNWCELGSAGGGYRFEQVVGYIYTNPTPGKTPLHRYINNDNVHHFYTTNWSELGAGGSGWKYEGITGYVDSSSTGANTALYRLYNPRKNDHFYTASSVEIGADPSWSLEKIECYVLK